MGRIVAWTLSLTGGIVVVRDPCLHGRFSIGSLCVGPSDTMSWSPTIGLLITPQEPIQPRLGVLGAEYRQRFLNTFRTERSTFEGNRAGLAASSTSEMLCVVRSGHGVACRSVATSPAGVTTSCP